jgi:hypothetical protein
MDMDTKEFSEKTLSHEKREEVRAFYAALPRPVLVGMHGVQEIQGGSSIRNRIWTGCVVNS